jgi:phosphoserine phosphatase RsbU/P
MNTDKYGDWRGYWRRLGRSGRVLLLLAAVSAILNYSRVSPAWLFVAEAAAIVSGTLVLVKLARRVMRKAIWRLRNRLIAAYLFIAVVPIVLILALVGLNAYVVIGQMAVYLVNKELDQRETSLFHQAEALARLPVRDPEATVNRFAMMTRDAFPDVQLLMSGRDDLRYPPGTALTPPPREWKQAYGLIVKKDGSVDHLFAWAHVLANGNEVTVLAPITEDWSAGLVPGLGDVYMPLVAHARRSRVPPQANALDLHVNWPYPVYVPSWDSPAAQNKLGLLVNTRASAVLGIVFGQKMEWGEIWLEVIAAVAVLFLLVEIASLVAGVQLSRTITGAVHELYQGTQHVKEGDFSYRIPVKGSDQLAELGSSFNTMTANLGRLIVVAKEKERLESELAIAREVQNQLFPKDVPYLKTLELKGVCNPARMVSGDYYDFMALSDTALAFAIGDVAGKGISAALLMATIQSTMRTQLSSLDGAGPYRFSTAQMVSTLNRQLYATTAPEKYATFYFALYDEATHSLAYTNAGHLAPLLFKYARADSSEMIARAMEAVVQWTGSSELQDDMTMVVARRI